MLNEFLFKSLKAVFGTVLVENEGVHADVVRDYTTGYTASWRMSDNGEHGEQYRVNCPFCRGKHNEPDRKQHLYISYLSYARPRVDGVELAVSGLLAHCFRGNCISDNVHRGELENLIRAGMACVGEGGDTVTIDLLNTQEEPSESKTSNEITLDGIRTWVPDYRPCTDGMDQDIAEYLYGRGLTDDMIARFGIGWGQVVTPRTGRLLNGGVPWVIIPVVMNGKLRGVQARCPDKFIGEDGLRYWIHPGMRKKTVVYNLDSARELGVGVVCEGVFDVFKVGAPGVCCFGHTPSTTQQSLLSSIDQGLILLPDTDVREGLDTLGEARALAMQWNADGRFPKGVHVVELPAKDAGMMSRQEVWTAILSQVSDEMRDYLIERTIGRL